MKRTDENAKKTTLLLKKSTIKKLSVEHMQQLQGGMVQVMTRPPQRPTLA